MRSSKQRKARGTVRPIAHSHFVAFYGDREGWVHEQLGRIPLQQPRIGERQPLARRGHCRQGVVLHPQRACKRHRQLRQAHAEPRPAAAAAASSCARGSAPACSRPRVARPTPAPTATATAAATATGGGGRSVSGLRSCTAGRLDDLQLRRANAHNTRSATVLRTRASAATPCPSLSWLPAG